MHFLDWWISYKDMICFSDKFDILVAFSFIPSMDNDAFNFKSAFTIPSLRLRNFRNKVWYSNLFPWLGYNPTVAILILDLTEIKSLGVILVISHQY